MCYRCAAQRPLQGTWQMSSTSRVPGHRLPLCCGQWVWRLRCRALGPGPAPGLTARPGRVPGSVLHTQARPGRACMSPAPLARPPHRGFPLTPPDWLQLPAFEHGCLEGVSHPGRGWASHICCECQLSSCLLIFRMTLHLLFLHSSPKTLTLLGAGQTADGPLRGEGTTEPPPPWYGPPATPPSRRTALGCDRRFPHHLHPWSPAPAQPVAPSDPGPSADPSLGPGRAWRCLCRVP